MLHKLADAICRFPPTVMSVIRRRNLPRRVVCIGLVLRGFSPRTFLQGGSRGDHATFFGGFRVFFFLFIPLATSLSVIASLLYFAAGLAKQRTSLGGVLSSCRCNFQGGMHYAWAEEANVALFGGRHGIKSNTGSSEVFEHSTGDC